MGHPTVSHDAHEGHEHHAHDHHGGGEQSLNRMSVAATLHCMTGCAIGEVLGLVIATALGWGPLASFALAISLAFVFGYLLTSIPLLKAGLAVGTVVPIALATDTFSITTMELADNLTMAVIPGAMDATLGDVLFWGAMVLGFAVAFPFTFLVNRALLRRGKGHALVHAYHQH
ncbi:MAG: DUF4396 domain-containing protein [Solirubrobacteraceae bacterium]|nr:DUF4396 domain-containing protein [Solirubrobacteraceae bacterium]